MAADYDNISQTGDMVGGGLKNVFSFFSGVFFCYANKHSTLCPCVYLYRDTAESLESDKPVILSPKGQRGNKLGAASDLCQRNEGGLLCYLGYRGNPHQHPTSGAEDTERHG